MSDSCDGVAIVGFAGRFPGAGTADVFWQNVKAGVESITTFPDDVLAAAGHDVRALRAEPGFVAARGIIDQPEWFDAAFFGMSPLEAEVTDPQQRLLLELAWEALEHAGYDPRACPGAVGVYAGVGANTYYLNWLLTRPDLLEAVGPMQELIGRDKDFVATRIAFKLDLKGPALSIHTACSTSLVTACQAAQALLGYQCDMALAGGASIVFPQATGYVFEDGGILSPDGHTRAFDAAAQGTVFSSGAGLVVLKRLADAVADGDRVYAVITGAALNNDGFYKASFTAPSATAHTEVIALAQALAGVEPGSIGYVEAHGTATPIGDPIEVAGLAGAFGAGAAPRSCALGSVKTNVGHLDIAAGVAGLIKTALAVAEGVVPPTLHYATPNPRIDFAATPFFVPTTLQPWPGPRPRRAGVSSFGVGGTNAHVVLEEAPAPASRNSSDAPSTLLVLSARTPGALEAATVRLADALATDPPASMRDVAHTLRTGRHPFACRRALVCADVAEGARLLRSGDPRELATGPHTDAAPSPVFMFPGGGAQHVAMGQGLLPHALVFRAELERCLSLVVAQSRDLAPVLWASGQTQDEAAARLEAPSWGLPALFAHEYALARQWMAWGVQPSALIGHSMGEYTAACLAGVMSLEDAMGIVLLRGQLFETLPAGGMLAVPLSERQIRGRLPSALAIAAINAEGSCVVSGEPTALAAFAETLESDGVECRRLRIAVAAHSPMVEPILAAFRRKLATIRLAAPAIPVISNVTGTWLSDRDARSPEYRVRHLRQTVRFSQGLATLCDTPGRVLIEVGPGQALSTFARQQVAPAPPLVLTSSRRVNDPVSDLAVLLQAVGRAWVGGLPIDWTGLPDTHDARRVPLPTYPFERQRFAPDLVPTVRVESTVPAPSGRDQSVTMIPAAPVLSPEPAATPGRRADRIANRLAAILQQLSGMPAAGLRHDVPFLELGFDSLFLTQASLRFKSEFTVRVTFRQLFEDAPTIAELARYIDAKLPADALPAPAAAPATPTAPTVAVAAAVTPGPPAESRPATFAPAVFPSAAAASAKSSVLPANAAALERVVHEQLRLMAEQLRLLGGMPLPAAAAGHDVAAPLREVPAEVATVPATGLGPAAPPAPVPPPAPAAPAVPGAPMRFGPFRGIDRSVQGLTAHQARSLDALVARYTTKTRASKALTAAQRTVLADPRAVSGFRKIWKEMVYQIATERSDGARVWDIDGHEYIDLTGGFGVNLCGFRVPWIDQAVVEQLAAGIELGTLSPLAKEVAELVRDLTGMERVTFANTGSEAISGAIRAVRTATGREWIAVFDDEYHGIAEEVLVKSVGPRGHRRSAPAAPGIPDSLVDRVIVLHYDDPDALDILRERAAEIAGVIIEPVQGRHPDFRPVEMIRAVRAVTAECDIPLIFDEMITGFRLHPRGAQGYFGVDVDLACYGKVMSGGLPIAAIAGKAQYLDAFDGGPWQFGDDSFPEGGVTFFGGTYTRNPLSLAAAAAALRHLKQAGPALQAELNARSDRFAGEVNALFASYRAPLHLEHCGSILSVTYTDDNPLTRLLVYYLREKGVHIWDRPFFVSTAHTDADLAQVVRVLDDSLAEMRAADFFGAPGPDRPGSGDPPDVVPFTDPQMEVWLGTQMSATASAAFNEVLALELTVPLDLAVLQHAVDDVTARHDSLRMTVNAMPPGFRVHPTMAVPVTVHDLTGADDVAAGRAEVLRGYNTRPMDFAHGPLWRVGVVRDAGRDVLVLSVHHVICDGWSFGVLLRELSHCYAARVAGTPHSLAPALQAVEYAQALAERRDSEEARATAAFWREQFRTVPEALALPTDRPRPALNQFPGRRLAFTLDADLAQRVRQFASAHRTTAFSTLLAAFEVLIHRLTGQTDFVVGIPMAGQALVAERDLIAHCVNFIPVRCALDPALPFAAHVAAVTRQALDLNEHQEHTYLTLLNALRLPRSVARDPLVSVSFTLEPAASAPVFAGLPAAMLTVPRTTSRRDLHVNVMEAPAGLMVELDYNSAIFDEGTVRAWMDAFRTCLVAAIVSPSQSLAELPLVSGGEWQRLTASRHDAAGDDASSHDTVSGHDAGQALRFDPSVPLPRLFEAQAARTPDAVAVTCEGRGLTYAALNVQANRIAHTLRARGVGPGVLVGVCLERGQWLVPALLGVLKAGGAYLPIDLAYPAERLAFMLADGGAPLLITQAALADRVPSTTATTLLVEDLLGGGGAESNPPASSGADDLAYVIYTSGTSGTPKGSRVSHRNVVSLMAGTAPLFAFGAGDVWTLFHSYAFDFSVWEIWGALLYGGRLVVVPQAVSRSPEAFYDLLADQRVTVLNQTPSAFRQLMIVDAARDLASLAALRYVVFGGEALDVRSLPPWFERHGENAPALVNMYGITETTVHVTHHRLRRADTGGGSVIGTAIPLWQVYLLDARQRPVPVGVPGELYVGGAGVTAGYLNRPDLTRERFVPNPFGAGMLYRSGDQARYLASGALEYLGRLDAQVKIRGFRIELGEVETVLTAHPAVAECRVVARHGPLDEPWLVAYVRSAGGPPDPEVLQAHLRRSLPDYMVPAVFVAVDAFPLTANGKLDVRVLPEPEAARLTRAATVALPLTATESRLAALWAELLALPAVTRTDNFFDLGGHSLLAIRLVHRIGEVFGVRLAPVALFEHARLEDLAGRIDEAAGPAPVASAVSVAGLPPAVPDATASVVAAAAPASPVVPAAYPAAVVQMPPARGARPVKVLAQMASGGRGTPFFWVHGISGEVFGYMPVSRHLAPQRPVYGFAADWTVAFADRDRTVQTIAAAYVRELVAIEPEGPYHLGGFCAAAVLGLEIARQLEATGRTVGALAVLDYAMQLRPDDGSMLTPALGFGRNLPRWIRDDAVPSGVAELAGRLRSKLRHWRTRTFHRSAGVGDVRDALGLWRFPESHVATLLLHQRVLAGYQSQPFGGRVTLLQPRTGPLFGPWPESGDLGWAPFAHGGVDAYSVPGSHSTFMSEPFAGALAARIEQSIRDAEAGQAIHVDRRVTASRRR